MRNAGDLVLVVTDGPAGGFRPRAFRAERVTVVAGAPAGGAALADDLDAHGDWPGEGDALVIRLRSLDDVER